jgi:hypothetical protein
MPLIRTGPGLIGAAARTAVVAGTATAVSGRVARRQQRKWAEDEGHAYEASAQPAESDYAAQLEQLAQLKAQGIITEDEFEAKKKQILGI